MSRADALAHPAAASTARACSFGPGAHPGREPRLLEGAHDQLTAS